RDSGSRASARGWSTPSFASDKPSGLTAASSRDSTASAVSSSEDTTAPALLGRRSRSGAARLPIRQIILVSPSFGEGRGPSQGEAHADAQRHHPIAKEFAVGGGTGVCPQQHVPPPAALAAGQRVAQLEPGDGAPADVPAAVLE